MYRRNLTVLVSIFSIAFSSQANSQSRVEIRYVVDSPSPSAVRATNELTHEQSSLASDVLFALRDIASVTATPDPSNPLNPLNPSTLTLTFKQTLKDSLRNSTSANIGKRVALVIDGRIIATPRITGAFTEALVQVPLPTYKYSSTIESIINAALKKQ